MQHHFFCPIIHLNRELPVKTRPQHTVAPAETPILRSQRRKPSGGISQIPSKIEPHSLKHIRPLFPSNSLDRDLPHFFQPQSRRSFSADHVDRKSAIDQEQQRFGIVHSRPNHHPPSSKLRGNCHRVSVWQSCGQRE